MNLFFLDPNTINQEDKSAEYPIVHNEPAHNTYEGSEFVDDAIRMRDQPLMFTEISVAVGCPENLL